MGINLKENKQGNKNNLDDTSGTRETYWLLAIQEANRLKGLWTQTVATVQNIT